MPGTGPGTTTPNPNGANQYLLDPRQNLCWKYYATPSSETFGNAKQSAIKAGYEEYYANTITSTQWFCDKVRRIGLLNKAEKVLEETLDIPVQVIKYDRSTRYGDEDDEDREPETYLATDPQLVRTRLDAAKFVASTQGKDEGYSTRSELTGKGGDALIPERADEEAAAAAVGSFLKNKHEGHRENSSEQGPKED